MLVKALIDFFFPAHCIICNHEIKDGLICDECLDLVTEIGPPLCPNCGRPIKKDKKCRRCKDQNLDRIRAWAYYLPPVDQMVHEFKYREKRSLAKFLGRRVAPVLRSDPNYEDINLIVPIPLHRKKERGRGFNQSELLAKEIGKELGLPVDNALIRVVNNPSQTGLTEKERRDNVQGIFRLNRDLDDLKILLVDDVMTTGSTIDEGARVLKEGGARVVLGAVTAIAP